MLPSSICLHPTEYAVFRTAKKPRSFAVLPKAVCSVARRVSSGHLSVQPVQDSGTRAGSAACAAPRSPLFKPARTSVLLRSHFYFMVAQNEYGVAHLILQYQ